MITKTLEEKLDDEERTEAQKCEVFKQILEDLNYYNDETNTGNSNQPKEDSTQKHEDKHQPALNLRSEKMHDNICY